MKKKKKNIYNLENSSNMSLKIIIQTENEHDVYIMHKISQRSYRDDKLITSFCIHPAFFFQILKQLSGVT